MTLPDVIVWGGKSIQLLLDLIRSVIPGLWPIAFLIFVFAFRHQIRKLLDNLSELVRDTTEARGFGVSVSTNRPKKMTVVIFWKVVKPL